MPVSEEMKLMIENEIKSITKKRTPDMKIQLFILRLSRYLAQIEEDKDRLVQSGFDEQQIIYYEALFTLLTEVHADRVAAEGKGPGKTTKEQMKKMEMYEVVLALVAECIIRKTKSDEIIIAFKAIKRGGTQADTLNDILALVSLIRPHLALLEGYTPGGITINDGYLSVVSNEAEQLLHILGEKAIPSSEREHLVDKQGKLITLCRNAIDDIRFAAKSAFFVDMEYYREHYSFYDHAYKIIAERDTMNEEEESEDTLETLSN